MSDNVETLLGQLTGLQRGFVLGALLFREQAASALEQLDGQFKQGCVAAVEAAVALERAARLDLTQRLTQQLLYGLSDGLDRVHPSWVAHLLADQPAPVSASVLRVLPPIHQQALPALGVGPASIPVQVALPLAQHLLSPLAPMVAPRDQAHAEGGDLLGTHAEPLVQTVRSAATLVLLQLARQAGSPLKARLREALPGLFDGTARRWAGRSPRLSSDVLARLAPAWKTCTSELLGHRSADGGSQRRTPERTDRALLPLGTMTSALALSKAVALSFAQQLPRDIGLRLFDAPAFGPDQELLDLLRLAQQWALEDSC